MCMRLTIMFCEFSMQIHVQAFYTISLQSRRFELKYGDGFEDMQKAALAFCILGSIALPCDLVLMRGNRLTYILEKATATSAEHFWSS